MALHVGDTVLLSTEFRVDGDLTDPTEVTVALRKPDGTPATATPSSDETGIYTATYVADQAGVWAYRWEGTGAAVGVDEGTFFVRDTLMGPRRGLCTLEEVRASLSDPDTSGDETLQRLIDDVTDAITKVAGREFLPLPSGGDDSIPEGVERAFAYNGRGHLSLHPYDLRDIYDLALDGTPLGLYRAMPEPSQTGTYTWIELPPGPAGLITIDGEWGMAQVPGNVRQAAITQVREWFTRDVARFSEAFGEEEGRIAIQNRSLSRHAWEVATSYRVALVA